MPLFPEGVNLRGLARTAAVGLMNASANPWSSTEEGPARCISVRRLDRIDPFDSARFMKRKMTFFGLGRKVRCFRLQGNFARVLEDPSRARSFFRSCAGAD